MMGTKEFKLLKASAFTEKVDEAKAELETFNQNAIVQAVNNAAAAVEDEFEAVKSETQGYRDKALTYSQNAEQSAEVAMARGLVFPTLAASQGLSLSDVAITNAGTGGTDGTYGVSMLSAGSGVKIRYTVSGGSITEAVVTSRGYGMDGTETITVSNPSDAVLTPVFQDTVVDGDYFWVVSADNSEVLELWFMGTVTATDTGKRTISTTATQEIIDYANEVYGKERLFYITDDSQSVRVAVGKDTLITETGNSIIVSLATS